MKKRMISLLVISVMGCMLLAGCGSGSQEQNNKAAASSAKAASSVSETAEKTPSVETEEAAASSETESAEEEKTAESSGEVYKLIWGCNSTGASYYQYAVQAADIINHNCPDIHIDCISTAGGIENCQFMDAGEANMGGITNVLELQYWDGNGALEDVDTSSSVAREFYYAYPVYWQMMVRGDDDSINSVDDFKGKNIAINVKGSVGYTQALYHFGALGFDILNEAGSITYISAGEAGDALLEGSIDVLFSGGGLGDATAMKIASSEHGLKLISFSDEEVETIMANSPAENLRTIPAGSYEGVDYDVQTIGITQINAVSESVPEDVVYEMITCLEEHHDEFADAIPIAEASTIENMINEHNPEIPWADGAIKYFEENGIEY